MLRLKLIANTLMEKTQIQGNWSKMKLVAVKFFEIDKNQLKNFLKIIINFLNLRNFENLWS